MRDICCSPRVLATPRPGLPYQTRCDCSGYAAGQSLWQLHTLLDQTTLWRPVEFRSKSFNTSERQRAADPRELLSFVVGLKNIRPFLIGFPSSVITNSSALAWLRTNRDQSPCLQRLWTYVISFVVTLQHRPCKSIVTEDDLSRRTLNTLWIRRTCCLCLTRTTMAFLSPLATRPRAPWPPRR